MNFSSGLFTYLQATQLLQIDIQPFEIVDSIAQQVVFGLSCGKLALPRYDARFFDIGRPWSRIFLQSHSDVLARGARVLVFDDDLHGFVPVVADRDLIGEGLLHISAKCLFRRTVTDFLPFDRNTAVGVQRQRQFVARGRSVETGRSQVGATVGDVGITTQNTRFLPVGDLRQQIDFGIEFGCRPSLFSYPVP